MSYSYLCNEYCFHFMSYIGNFVYWTPCIRSPKNYRLLSKS